MIQFNITILFIALIVSCIIYYFYSRKEYFMSYTKTYDNSKIVHFDVSAKSNNLLSNGHIHKYFDGKIYNYHYQFNLPLVTGNYFNKKIGTYTVFMGKSDTKLQKVGELTRMSDGMYTYKLRSPVNYTVTHIRYEHSDDPKIFEVIFSKNF